MGWQEKSDTGNRHCLGLIASTHISDTTGLYTIEDLLSSGEVLRIRVEESCHGQNAFVASMVIGYRHEC
jgi:hypothetical protein